MKLSYRSIIMIIVESLQRRTSLPLFIFLDTGKGTQRATVNDYEVNLHYKCKKRGDVRNANIHMTQLQVVSYSRYVLFYKGQKQAVTPSKRNSKGMGMAES